MIQKFPLLRIIQERQKLQFRKIYVPQCPQQHCFTIAKTWKQPECPLTEEWIKTMWYIPRDTHSSYMPSEVRLGNNYLKQETADMVFHKSCSHW